MTDEQPEGSGAEGSGAAGSPPDATQPGTPAEAAPETPPAEAAGPSPARSGLLVPVWLAALLAVLLVFGLGFLIGWVAAPGGGHDGAERIGRVFPGGLPGGGGGPFGRVPGGPGGGGRLPQGNQAFLGVQTAAASSGQSGVTIAAVEPGSPADQAGLKAGDVVTAVDGTAVNSPAELAQRIHAHQPGDQVTLAYTRNGSSAQAQVKLGSPTGGATPQTIPQTPS